MSPPHPDLVVSTPFLVAVGAVSGGVVVVAATVAGGAAALLLAASGLVAALMIRLPAHWWPSVLLLVTAAAPASTLPVPGMQGQNGSVSPTLLLLPLWGAALLRLRSVTWTRQRRLVALSAVPLLAALAASTAQNGFSAGSAAWALNLVLMTFVVPVLMTAEAASALARTVTVTGAVLGAYAVIEAHVLGSNPVWSWASVGDSRADVSFGHPLYAASFFAVAVVVAVHDLARRPTPSTALIAAACGAGLASAGSRGALVAAVTGLVGLSVAVVLGRAGSRRQLAPLAIVALLFVAVVAAGLAQRAAAGGTEGSNTVRARSLETGLVIAADTDILGGGPGRAYELKVSTPGPGTDEQRSIENSWLELYVALGPAGATAFVLPVAVVLGIGVRNRRWLGVAATAALLVAYTFYNALEGGKPLTMLLLGIALAWCVAPAPGHQPHDHRRALSARSRIGRGTGPVSRRREKRAQAADPLGDLVGAPTP